MVRRARPIVRAASGTVLSKRFLLNKFDIPDVSATDFDNPVTVDLAECTETMDEEVESDGTNIADVPLYSRFTGIKANLVITAGSPSIVRWMLFRSPDNDISGANAMAVFHASDDTATTRELRRNTLAKGILAISASSLANPLRVFVRRSAVKRVQSMREGDRIKLVLAKHADGTDADLSGFGTLYFRANG